MFLEVELRFFSFIYDYYEITLYRFVRAGVQQFLKLQRFLSLSSDGTIRDKFFLGVPLVTTIIGVPSRSHAFRGSLSGTSLIGVLFQECTQVFFYNIMVFSSYVISMHHLLCEVRDYQCGHQSTFWSLESVLNFRDLTRTGLTHLPPHLNNIFLYNHFFFRK